MRITIDRAGRIVVPKAIRESMGLQAGSELEMTFEAGLLTFSLPSVVTERADDQGRVYFVAPEGAAPLTDADVRSVLESVRP